MAAPCESDFYHDCVTRPCASCPEACEFCGEHEFSCRCDDDGYEASG